MNNPSTYLRWVEIFAALAAILTSAEVYLRKSQFASGGLWDWQVWKLRNVAFIAPDKERFFNAIYDLPGYRLIHGLRVWAAVYLLFCGGLLPSVGSLACGLIALVSYLQNSRASAGLDGADQMITILFTVLFLAYAIGGPTAERYALYFIAFQASLAYLAAGLSKFYSVKWRKEPMLAGILSSETYGTRSVSEWLSLHPTVDIIITRFTFIYEILFPVALILPPSFCLMVIFCAGIFHASTAIVMGLNTFFWAFLATYPAVFFVNQDIRLLHS